MKTCLWNAKYPTKTRIQEFGNREKPKPSTCYTQRAFQFYLSCIVVAEIRLRFGAFSCVVDQVRRQSSFDKRCGRNLVGRCCFKFTNSRAQFVNVLSLMLSQLYKQKNSFNYLYAAFKARVQDKDLTKCVVLRGNDPHPTLKITRSQH